MESNRSLPQTKRVNQLPYGLLAMALKKRLDRFPTTQKSKVTTVFKIPPYLSTPLATMSQCCSLTLLFFIAFISTYYSFCLLSFLLEYEFSKGRDFVVLIATFPEPRKMLSI